MNDVNTEIKAGLEEMQKSICEALRINFELQFGTNKKQPIEKGQAAEWRRFEIINTENQQAFEQLVCEKQLSREDLMLILKTIKLRNL